MEKTRKNEFRIARARRTAFGRFICRLAGEEAGAVMMEYVVLAVLAVAAVVAAVIGFGDGLRNRFEVMYHSLFGHTKTAQTTVETGESAKTTNISAGQEHHKKVSGNNQ